MTTKNKIFLSLSILIFVATLFGIFTIDLNNGTLDASISVSWIIIFVLALLLPIFNLAEIIINRDDWNKFYWLGLIFNIITFLFIAKYFNIDINVFSQLFN